MEPPEPQPRRRLRVSLLSLLLLTTVVAVSIFAGLLWSEVEPLRREVEQLRSETGHLTIADPSKIYVTQIDTLEDDTWKWRVYLPPGTKYELREIFGSVPSRRPGMSLSKWFEAGGMTCSSEIAPGEFVITVALRPYTTKTSPPTGNWHFVVEYRHVATPTVSQGGRCGSQGVDWMDDRRARGFTGGDAHQLDKQHEFDASRGIVLLTLLRSTVTERANGWSATPPNTALENDGAAIGIVPISK